MPKFVPFNYSYLSLLIFVGKVLESNEIILMGVEVCSSSEFSDFV